MKYVKTFESFSDEMEVQKSLDMPSGLTPNSPEIQEMTAKLARKKGLEEAEVLEIQDELKKEPIKTNEEEEPFTLLTAALLVAGPVLFAALGFGHTALAKNRGLRVVVMEEAERRAKEIVEKNPEAAKDLDSLSQAIFDNLMNDKEAWEDAKVCALIAVNEVISSNPIEYSNMQYWQEVKQEICDL
jgi:hypothetical protein